MTEKRFKVNADYLNNLDSIIDNETGSEHDYLEIEELMNGLNDENKELKKEVDEQNKAFKELKKENKELKKEVNEQDRRKWACLKTAHRFYLENEQLKQENKELKKENL